MLVVHHRRHWIRFWRCRCGAHHPCARAIDAAGAALGGVL